MKNILILFSVLFTFQTQAADVKKATSRLPHLPPDATTQEYQVALEKKTKSPFYTLRITGLEEVEEVGLRNLEWLKHMNSFLPADKKLSFTSKATQSGIPIDKPNEYSPSIIQKDFAQLVKDLPVEMKTVLIDGAGFTQTPPIATEDYITWGRKTDRLYQIAMRWRLLQDWLAELAKERRRDIRGYYFFERLQDRDKKLADITKVSAEEAAQIRDWLVSMCLNNNRTLDACRQTMNKESLTDFRHLYQSYLKKSQTTWENFFRIPISAERRDVKWPSEKLTTVPFKIPDTPEIQSFLSDNIEDEWKFNDWQLKLDFKATGMDIPYIEFQAGVTPHVDELGGNQIVMDANQPITEYDSQWTIRHEFGHVLGIPDCYVEFYDSDKKSIFNYQIDIDNLMCSRRGHIQEVHVQELRRAYGTP